MYKFGHEIIAENSGTRCPVLVAQYGRYIHEEYNNSSLVQREVNNVINSIKHRIGGWLCFMHSIEPQATAKLFVLYKSALDKEKANCQQR